MDGPCSGVARQAIGFGKLYLLDFKIRIPHSARRKTIVKAYEKMDIGKKWEQSAWAKKLVAKAKKASITDFERFKVKCLKQQVSVVCRNVVTFSSLPLPSPHNHQRARVLNKKFKELKKAQAVQS